MNHRCRVIEPYRCAFPDPLILLQVDVLVTSGKGSIYSGGVWLWCTTRSDKSGWVPLNYLQRDGNDCTMRCDYDATEQTAAAGDELTILNEESGWLWCLTPKGLRGWIPAENVERL
jgi:hypothetical protein